MTIGGTRRRPLTAIAVTMWIVSFAPPGASAAGTIKPAVHPAPDALPDRAPGSEGSIYADWLERLEVPLLRRDLPALLTLEQRRRFAHLQIVAIRRGGRFPSTCQQAHNLGYRTVVGGAALVGLCAPNAVFINFLSAQQLSFMYLQDRFLKADDVESYGEQLARTYNRNRGIALLAPRLKVGCSYEYFLFLKERGLAEQCSRAERPGPEFEAWRTRNDYLVDRRKLAAIKRQDGDLTALDDAQAVDRIQLLSRDFMAEQLRYVVLHEIGHGVLGHPLGSQGCALLAEERAADAFASDMLISLRLMDQEEIAIAQLNRAYYVVTVSVMQPGSAISQGITYDRAQIGVVAAAKILRQNRRNLPPGALNPAAIKAVNALAAEMDRNLACD